MKTSLLATGGRPTDAQRFRAHRSGYLTQTVAVHADGRFAQWFEALSSFPCAQRTHARRTLLRRFPLTALRVIAAHLTLRPGTSLAVTGKQANGWVWTIFVTRPSR